MTDEPPSSEEGNPAHPAPAHGRGLLALCLAALGVVYGDIGTSPLYAIKECFAPEYGLAPTVDNVLGVLSLVFWSLNFVVTSSTSRSSCGPTTGARAASWPCSRCCSPRRAEPKTRRILVTLGLFGSALLYGDGVITPAISVLGAVEGLRVAAPRLPDWGVPAISALILVGPVPHSAARNGEGGCALRPGDGRLVHLDRRRSASAASCKHPGVLRALNPWYAHRILHHDGLRGFLVLGAVVLVVTGGEALYADMGHFGARPIRRAWFAVVLPALTAQLLRAGRAAARRPVGHHQSVLCARSRAGRSTRWWRSPRRRPSSRRRR